MRYCSRCRTPSARIVGSACTEPDCTGTLTDGLSTSPIWMFEGQPSAGQIKHERQTMQDDIAAILRALGVSDHARPQSPHDVVQTVILPQIHALRKLLEGVQRNDRVALASPVLTGAPPEQKPAPTRQPTLSDVRDRKLGMMHTVALMAAQLEAGDRASGNGIAPVYEYVARAVEMTRHIEQQIGRL